MTRWRLVSLLALAPVVVGGCAEGALDPDLAVEGPGAAAGGSEECVDVEWCDPDGDVGGPGTFDWNLFRGFIGSWNDTNLYQAPGDPNPAAPGVWLGTSVTPGACTTTSGPLDIDGDGFLDSCELSLARSFAPYLQFAAGEPCAKGAPAWAVRSPSHGVVRIAYMMAYYYDCGSGVLINGNRWKGGHAGDSEIVTLRVRHNAATGHWEFVEMFTSAHSGEPFGFDQSRWSSAPAVTFPVKSLTFPMVWVAQRKHANYPSPGICNSVRNQDYCTSDPPIRYRFPVDPYRNTSEYGLPSCLSSPDFPGVECFFSLYSFKGWQEGASGVTAYVYMLSRGGFWDS